MAQAPDIKNYYIGKGILSFKKEGEMAFVDVGNVPEFEVTPELEELAHNSSRSGVRTRDRTVVVEKSLTVRMVMEEWNVRNLAMAFLGSDPEQSTDGKTTFELFASNAISGQLKFTGTNEVGPRYEFLFNKVDFIPGSSISLISDEWGQLEITGTAATVDGRFGTVTLLGEEDESGETSEESSEPVTA